MSLNDQAISDWNARREFVSTHWSVVLRAGQKESPQSAAALEALCNIYWYPVYAFLRRQGSSPHDAADQTQDFFSHLLSTHALATVDPSKGKFRSFLLASLKNRSANEWRRANCQKRGGGARILSLDEEQAEDRYQLDAVDPLSPDKMFERRWAESLLARALAQLRRECDDDDKARRFDEVKTFLLGEKSEDTLAAVAARLNLSLPAVKGLVHRLRSRFRELIREEIAQTVASREEIEQEIQDLFSAFEV